MLPSPQLLAAARILAKLTQEEFARVAGVSLSTVKRLEIGQNAPSGTTLGRLQRALITYGVQFVFDAEGQFEGVRRRLSDSNLGQSNLPMKT